MPTLTDDAIRKELKIYGVSATAGICSAIRAYIPLLLRWNQTISLTTVTDPLDILRFHFGESMFAAPAILCLNGRLADVGSGAGFPGIPLKLVIPSLNVVLIEPNAKKAAFLAEAVRVLGLDIEVCRGRFEELAIVPGFDFITARALGMQDELASWARSAIHDGGRIMLWLGLDDAAQVSMNNLWHWSEPLPIPGSHSRAILVGVPA